MKKVRALICFTTLLLVVMLIASCGVSPVQLQPPGSVQPQSPGPVDPAPVNARNQFLYVFGERNDSTYDNPGFEIQVSKIDGATGTLLPEGTYLVTGGRIAVDPTNTYLFSGAFPVGETNPRELATYWINPETGGLEQNASGTWMEPDVFLTPTLAVNAGGGLTTLRFDPTSFGEQRGQVSTLQSYPDDTKDYTLAPPPRDGIFYYRESYATVGYDSYDTVQHWVAARVDPATGVISETWRVFGGVISDHDPKPPALDFGKVAYSNDGTRVVTAYSANDWTAHMGVLQRDLSTGALTPLSALNDLPLQGYGLVVAAPNGFFYTTSVEGSTISAFQLNVSGDALLYVPQFDTKLPVHGITTLMVTPDGHFLIAMDNQYAPHDLYVVRINGVGSLVQVQGSPFHTPVHAEWGSSVIAAPPR